MAIGTPSESPAIVVKEIDASGVVPNVQSTTGAIAIKSRWGPVDQAVSISDEAHLASVFGSPSDSTAVDFMSAAYFLKYSNQMKVVRAINGTARNAADSAGAVTLIRNKDAFDASTHNTCKFLARYPGEMGNSISVVWADSAAWAGWDSAYSGQFDGKPGDGGNEIHILVLDKDGVVTGTPSSVLERYPYSSKNTSATNADGSSNYMKDVINRASNYIYMVKPVTSTGSVDLVGGLAKIDNTGETDLLSAYDKLEDKDTVQLDFLITPSMANETDNATVINDLVATAESRKAVSYTHLRAHET